MIISAHSLVNYYKSEIGKMGGDDESSTAVPSFDGFVMLIIVAFSLAIAGSGLFGIFRFLQSENFPMVVISLLLSVAGIYSALGVYREFVTMGMISKMLSDLEDGSKMEVIGALLDKDRNLTLIERLLGMVESIFSTKKNVLNT